jgi:imidazolonepropionase-like amidohydrolase
MRVRYALATATLAVTLVGGASLLAQRPAAPHVVAMVGGTLIDGFGSTPIRNSVILIDGERITAIGQVGSLAVPAGAEIISTEGMSVLPGLWDMHVHTMLNGHPDYDHWDKTYLNRLESEIMPASAKQLLMAGVTTARDLGAPLEASLHVRDAINKGTRLGATLYVSGPSIQHEPYPGTEAFRWGVTSPADGRSKVDTLADAGVDVIKLIDQDQMNEAEVAAVIAEAHKRGLPVVAHAHRPDEIRLAMKYGADDLEHTGLATAPEFPADIIAMLEARTAQMSKGPFFWTPTLTPLWNYEYMRDNPEMLDDPSWQVGLAADTVADIKAALRHPDQFPYYQLSPARKPTLRRKFEQLQKAGVTLMIGTDNGVPMMFQSQTTWMEMDIWARELGVPAMDVIRAATYWPSVMMKKDKDVGTVSAGKIADIIAVRGDVLRYIDLLQRVDIVVQHGKRVK